MKRTGFDHPKIRRLARVLNLKRYQAVGLLECLWHFTSKHAIRGDVGKWTDEEIADAIEWDRDAGQLIEALAETRLIDPHPTLRFVVHDWHDHADESTRKTVRKNYRTFASEPESFSTVPECSGQPEPEPEPKPEPKPRPEPEPVATAKPSNGCGRVRTGGVFTDLVPDDLRDTGRLLDWIDRASRASKPVITASAADCLRVVGAAERAREHGDNPVGLFVSIVSKGQWELITQAQEDRANRRIKEHEQKLRGERNGERRLPRPADGDPVPMAESFRKLRERTST